MKIVVGVDDSPAGEAALRTAIRYAEKLGAEVDAVGRPWSGAFANVRFGWLESQFLDYLQVDQFLVSGGGSGVPVEFRERQASG